jgi:hypothetical protein|tara:strand:+ start:954 stop:1211 length:258 start_codon:yes stop_codon:yes gene_type:complete
MLYADGFEEAIIGIARRCTQPDIVAYSVEKILGILQDRDGMDYEEALEFFEFNILGAWFGDETPVFIEKEDRHGHDEMEIHPSTH